MAMKPLHSRGTGVPAETIKDFFVAFRPQRGGGLLPAAARPRHPDLSKENLTMHPSETKLHAPHAAALIAAIGLSASALGVLSVDPATSVGAGTQPSGLASGDFDGDGDRDLVTTVDDANDIVVL
ncbi:MAG: hypothetical protein ACYTAU_06590, partial [Planctomycetota bacterium]